VPVRTSRWSVWATRSIICRRRALLSALVLISNTMTTLVAEQTSEIGIMKAVGGRRRQIAAVYLKTALLLGGLGTVGGIVLGAVLAYVLTRFFGSTFFAVGVGFGIDWPIVGISALAGLLGPPLAALPAIRRAVRVPVRDALEATGSAVGGQDAGDRLLRRVCASCPERRRSGCATWAGADGAACPRRW
jgi:putative ABC transport system permease protein